MVTNLSTVIVAEYTAALKVTKAFKQHFPTGIIQATTSDFAEAETLIHRHQPNLVIVEIELTNNNAVTMLDNLSPYHFEVLFISRTKTTQTKYFTYTNITCLNIPFEPDEMKYAFNKAYEKISYHSMLLPGNIERDMSIEHSMMHMKLPIFDQGKTHLIPMCDIAYLHSNDGYTDVYQNDKTIRQSTKPIGGLIPLLPTNIFCRIKKGYVVNIMSVSAHFIVKEELFLQMKNGEIIPVSNTYKNGFMSLMNTVCI